MSVYNGDYWDCNECREHSYCTTFLRCELCGYVQDMHKPNFYHEKQLLIDMNTFFKWSMQNKNPYVKAQLKSLLQMYVKEGGNDVFVR